MIFESKDRFMQRKYHQSKYTYISTSYSALRNIKINDGNKEEIEELKEKLRKYLEEYEPKINNKHITAQQLFKIDPLQDKSSNKKESVKLLTKVRTLSYILPRKYREEFLGDINEIYYELQKAGYSKLWTYFILGGNILNVFWAGIKLRYSEVFEGTKKADSEK